MSTVEHWTTALPLAGFTVSAIQTELIAAIGKHGFDRTPFNPDLSDQDKLVVLVEEVGEVARALTYDQGDREHLTHELIQVAAMAASWAQSLDTREG